MNEYQGLAFKLCSEGHSCPGCGQLLDPDERKAFYSAEDWKQARKNEASWTFWHPEHLAEFVSKNELLTQTELEN